MVRTEHFENLCSGLLLSMVDLISGEYAKVVKKGLKMFDFNHCYEAPLLQAKWRYPDVAISLSLLIEMYDEQTGDVVKSANF